MKIGTLIRWSTTLVLAGILCLSLRVASRAMDENVEEAVGTPAVHVLNPSVAAAGVEPGQASAEALGSQQAPEADGGSTKARAAEEGERRWSLFNLVSALFNLFIALGLIARLAFIILRDESYEQQVWERVRNPRTLDDMRMASALYGGRLDEFEEFEGLGRRPTVFDQLCASACVVLALVSLVLFFIVADLNTPMVTFDALSPLFGVIAALILFGVVLSLLSGSRMVGRESRSASVARWGFDGQWDVEDMRDSEEWRDSEELRECWNLAETVEIECSEERQGSREAGGSEGRR
jgi:hypothetical protein